MLAVKRAKALIQSASFSMLNKIYANNIPDTENDNSHETICLITDVGTDIALQGNMDFHALDQTVEVQVFYSLDAQDPADFETQLMHLFIRNGWSKIDDSPHIFDPDTHQLTMTWYFNYFEIEKEGKD